MLSWMWEAVEQWDQTNLTFKTIKCRQNAPKEVLLGLISDCHLEMNAEAFEESFQNKLLPALTKPSITVLDNASYIVVWRKRNQLVHREKLIYRPGRNSITFILKRNVLKAHSV
jgi:hypothetical protein